MQVALDVDAAGHREQRRQQHDERDVVEKQQVDDLVDRGRDTVNQRERDDDQRRPDGGDLAEMVMPEGRRGERHDRDRQQDAGERDHPEEAEMASVDRRGIGSGRQCRQREGEGEQARQQVSEFHQPT